MAISIILADDHPVVRRGMQALLESERDFSIVGVASDGLEAVGLTERLKPDVVVLDLMMPVLSGWEVLRERARDPELQQIPVILISAARGPEISEAVDKGVCAFLPKPFDIGALTALVRSCIPETR